VKNAFADADFQQEADSPVEATTPAEVRGLINRGPMSRFQVIAIAICVALNMLDGFDVLVMAFTAPFVDAEWTLSGTQLGLLLSAGLVGMAAGSLFLSPWADRVGRRPLIVLSLMLISAGMLASAFAQHPWQLAVLRAFTGVGVGVGGILASMSVITSEYASDRWRSTAISIMTTGYTVGATLGGTVAAGLLTLYGWRSVFWFGGMLSLLMLPIVLWRLPESLDFLLARPHSDALPKLNRLMRLMERPALNALPAIPHAAIIATASAGSILFRRTLRSTLLIWGAFFLLMSGFYFVMSWTPKLLVQAGLSATQGVTGGVLVNFGGVVGGLLFALLAARFALARVTAIYLICAAVMLVLFGLCLGQLSAALWVGGLIGAFVSGSMAGLYSLIPLLYPPTARVTGVGWAIGIGRIGAIIAPLLAGALIDRGWQSAELFYLFSVPFVLSLAAVLAIRIPQGT
jgi:benzoate transport